MRPLRSPLTIALALLPWNAPAAGAQIEIVTSTPTLADLARQVGGEHVEVTSIMRGPENPHNVIAKPSFMMKLRGADLFVHTGLDGEPWVPLLVKGARRSHLLMGADGNVDASVGIPVKERPERGELTRAQGDIHAFGNPHYLLDPSNAPIVAARLARVFAREDPVHAGDFERNAASFGERLADLEARLDALMAPHRGAKVATYHRAWRYFLDRFGLEKVAEIEPKPGISPWPAHLEQCIERMRSQGARVVIVETYSSRKSAEVVAARVGGKAVVLGQEVNALDGADTYEALLEHNVRRLVAALDAVAESTESESDEAAHRR